MTRYHVTKTKLVRRIKTQGLRVLQPSNWVNGNGERYGGGAIHAFQSRFDALRWASRMDWEMHRETGSGKISILTIEGDQNQWDTDFNDTLSQLGSHAQWVKTFTSVPAGCILASEPFTPAMAKQLVAALKERQTTIQMMDETDDLTKPLE
jgi:hypothetical protein